MRQNEHEEKSDGDEKQLTVRNITKRVRARTKKYSHRTVTALAASQPSNCAVRNNCEPVFGCSLIHMMGSAMLCMH